MSELIYKVNFLELPQPSEQCHLLEPKLLQIFKISSDPYLIFQSIMTLRRECCSNHCPDKTVWHLIPHHPHPETLPVIADSITVFAMHTTFY
jgi:hypothetical protein